MIGVSKQVIDDVELFHYTTASALNGILEDGDLHITHIRYLNDRTEYSGALEYAYTQLRRLRNQRPTAESTRAEWALAYEIASALEEMKPEGSKTLQMANVYVTSFSRDCDDISQWRAYCAGGGYAIGVHMKDLKAFAESTSAQFVECKYGKAGQRKWFREQVAFVRRRFEESGKSEDGDTEHTEQDKGGAIYAVQGDVLGRSLRSTAPAVKHRSFKDEREWRLVFSDLYGGPYEEYFREKKGALVPFVKIPCKDLPLASVWIGPTQDPKREALAVRKLLDRYRPREPIDVEVSDIPYRE